MGEAQGVVDPYWLPLGASGHFVRLCGTLYGRAPGWEAGRVAAARL